MKNYLLFAILISSGTLFSQLSQTETKENYFGSAVQIGSSVTFIWEKNEWQSNHFYGETTLNLNTAMRLSKRFWLGIHTMPIFTNEKYGSSNNRSSYYMAGIFSQFDFLVDKDMRLFGETSINVSDYCTCGDEAPRYDSNLFKWGGGASLELPITHFPKNNLWFELGFYNYVILNDIADKYNFTQYIFGLNYRIGR